MEMIRRTGREEMGARGRRRGRRAREREVSVERALVSDPGREGKAYQGGRPVLGRSHA